MNFCGFLLMTSKSAYLRVSSDFDEFPTLKNVFRAKMGHFSTNALASGCVRVRIEFAF